MEWISVKDQKPQFGRQHRYLFINGKKEITYGCAYAPKDGWIVDNETIVWIHDMDIDTNEVATYWMSLPSPPSV